MKKLFYILLATFLPFSVSARVVIPFWHAFSGHLGQSIVQLCESFNQSQKKYLIKPIYKGTYQEVLTSFVASFKAHKQPPLVQIFEVGSALMIYPRGVIVPVDKLFNDNSILQKKIQPSIYHYYSDIHGRLQAFPLNSSAPVLFYNKTQFDKLKIAPPNTWEELIEISNKIRVKHPNICLLSTTYPAWIHIESFLTWHGLSLISEQDKNQYTLTYTQAPLIYHLNFLKRIKEEKIFKYGGREGNGLSNFISGHCLMVTESSGAYGSLSRVVPFELGVSSLPYWHKFKSTKRYTTIGGAALWISRGFDQATYQGIKAFFKYLMRPEVQAWWSKETGYLPVGLKAIDILKREPNNAKLKAVFIGLSQIAATPQKAFKDNQIGYYALIRLFNAQQIEAILSGLISAKAALKTSQTYANLLQERFLEILKPEGFKGDQ